MNKIVGEIINGYKVESYDHKEKVKNGYKHYYTVCFLATGNVYEAQERTKVRKGKCKDLVQIKLEHSKAKAQRIKERNRLSKKSVESYERIPNIADKFCLSVDGSTKSTGFAIAHNNQIIKSGQIPVDEKINTSLRMVIMCIEIEKIIKAYNIDVVFYETIFLRNVKVLMILARLMGMMEFIALKHGCKFILIQPSSWKDYHKLGYDRPEQKANSIKKASALLGRATGEDESDAINMLIYCCKELGCT